MGRRASMAAKGHRSANRYARYPTIEFSDFKMGLHSDQQTIILSDFMTTRRKLEEENQQLREELKAAHMMIRILKQRAEVSRRKQSSKDSKTSVGSQDTTVEAGNQSKYAKALEGAEKQNSKLSKKKSLRNNVFLNPVAPGAKTFALTEVKVTNKTSAPPAANRQRHGDKKKSATTTTKEEALPDVTRSVVDKLAFPEGDDVPSSPRQRHKKNKKMKAARVAAVKNKAVEPIPRDTLGIASRTAVKANLKAASETPSKDKANHKVTSRTPSPDGDDATKTVIGKLATTLINEYGSVSQSNDGSVYTEKVEG